MRSFDDLSGVAEKHVQIDHGADQIYGDPIVLATEGWHTITYWGVDKKVKAAATANPSRMLRMTIHFRRRNTDRYVLSSMFYHAPTEDFHPDVNSFRLAVNGYDQSCG